MGGLLSRPVHLPELLLCPLCLVLEGRTLGLGRLRDGWLLDEDHGSDVLDVAEVLPGYRCRAAGIGGLSGYRGSRIRPLTCRASPETRKTPRLRGLEVVAGVGFEPTTFGL